MKKTVILIVVTLLMVMSTYASRSEYVSFNVIDQDIKIVLKGIATASGINLIAEKNVSGKITLELKDVYFEKALELIAKTNGYTIRKEDNTYIIGEAARLSEGFDVGFNKTFQLQNAKAADIAGIMANIFKGNEEKIEVTADDRINTIIVTGSSQVMAKIDDLVRKLDVPVPQVMIEAKVVEVSTDNTKNLGMNWGWGTGGQTNGKIVTQSEMFKKQPFGQSYTNQIGDKAPGFAMGDFFRDGMYFEAALQASATITDSKILSNPKIIASNGIEARVQVGDKVIYTGGVNQPPQEKDTGVVLTVIPRINNSDYITLEVEPEVSDAQFVKPGAGSESSDYPIIKRRYAKTTVTVKDGEEILIGGLIQETNEVSESKVPVLGDIPFFRQFFSSKRTGRKASELIILITPRIIKRVEG
ncbi:MAG: secretin N-terminal domain-containing protein [Candidatus Muiribacteriota bacterium]